MIFRRVCFIMALLLTTTAASAQEATPTMSPGIDPTSTPDNGGQTGFDGETCPLPVADMPENTLVFCLGVQMTLPDGWALTEGTADLDSFASINRANFSASDSVTVTEISPAYRPEDYIRDTVSAIALAAGHTAFDPAEHIVMAIDTDGLKAQYYDPADFVEPLDENTVRQVVFIVTLNDDLFVAHLFSWVPDFAGEGVENEIEQLAMSTRTADFYDGTPATIEYQGATVFVFDVTYANSTYQIQIGGEPFVIVRCPPGGRGNEATVWGTDIYTHDSSMCLAAAHAGAISLSDGGMVILTMLPGEASYIGSTRNGVTTANYGAWGASFSVGPLTP